jgi:CheY-like chemotaxis protein
MAELAGLRALVVEDEGSVAWLIEGMLQELGCEVAASVVTLAEALAAATDKSFDFAVLDVNLAGERVFPVAELLQRRQLPFLFSTGYGRMGVPATFRGCEVLNKPFGIDELKRKLCIILGKQR